MQISPKSNDRILLLAILFSGFSGLGYELIWTKLLGLSLGSETVAVYGTLAGYFGGMSLGALLFHRRVLQAKNPVLWYVVFELILGVYALIMPLIFVQLPQFLPVILHSLVGQNNSIFGLIVAFVVSGSLCLPATICLGATLPAIVESRKRSMPKDHHGRGLGRLYAINTLGGTVGIFCTIYAILPRFGMLWGSVILAGGSICAAGIAFVWDRGINAAQPNNGQTINSENETTIPKALLYGVLLCLGFAGIAFEMVGIQILSQIFRNTIFTFANILGVFLVGTALGAWIYSVVIKKSSSSFFEMLGYLLFGLTLSVLLSSFPLVHAAALLETISPLLTSAFKQHLVGELIVSLMVFFIPTLFMGALFSHVTAQFSNSGIGRALAINTAGSTLAPLLFAFLLIKALGYSGSFYFIVGFYFVLLAMVILASKKRPLFIVISFATLIVAALFTPKDCAVLTIGRGKRLVKGYESVMGQVMVLEEKVPAYGSQRNRFLQVDRYYTMGGGDIQKEKLQGYMPLLYTEGVGRICFLGVGTGIFVNAARAFDFDTIDAVEIVPAIIQSLRYFSTHNDGLLNAKEVNIYCSDARRFIFASPYTYDVIFGDLFHPSRPGATFLLSIEHFAAIKSRLKENGQFIQFIPLYQYDEEALKVVMRTFQQIFPHCHALLGRADYRNVMILIGINNKEQLPFIDGKKIEERISQNKQVNDLIPQLSQLLGYYLFDNKTIAEFVGPGPINRDLHPRIMFDVPKLAYESIPKERVASLRAVLNHKMLFPPGLTYTQSDDSLITLQNEIKDFGQAIVNYLLGEIATIEAGFRADRPKEAIAQYVKSYELHPEFALSQGIPFKLSPDFDNYYKEIFPPMIQRTPQIKWLYVDYLNFLKNRVGDTEEYEKYFAKAAPIFGGSDSLNYILNTSDVFQ